LLIGIINKAKQISLRVMW